MSFTPFYCSTPVLNFLLKKNSAKYCHVYVISPGYFIFSTPILTVVQGFPSFAPVFFFFFFFKGKKFSARVTLRLLTAFMIYLN